MNKDRTSWVQMCIIISAVWFAKGDTLGAVFGFVWIAIPFWLLFVRDKH